eukprot:gene51080-39288_t
MQSSTHNKNKHASDVTLGTVTIPLGDVIAKMDDDCHRVLCDQWFPLSRSTVRTTKRVGRVRVALEYERSTLRQCGGAGAAAADVPAPALAWELGGAGGWRAACALVRWRGARRGRYLLFLAAAHAAAAVAAPAPMLRWAVVA